MRTFSYAAAALVVVGAVLPITLGFQPSSPQRTTMQKSSSSSSSSQLFSSPQFQGFRAEQDAAAGPGRQVSPRDAAIPDAA